MKGKVLKSTGKWYIVELNNGETVNCRIRGKIRLEGLSTTNPVSVGDNVILSENSDEEGNHVITEIEKRTNYIVRKSTNLSKQMQILAANIDRAYLVITIKNPVTQLAFIDRFLVSAESFRIPTTILINKIDLYSEDELEYAKALAFMYEQIGYPTRLINAENAASLSFLKDEINGKQVMVSGHSGVGKSTLINNLDPNLFLKTGEISDIHLQGKHTTTFAEMHKLSSGGYIIDTPGIRAFGIIEIEKEHISHYFPEMRELLNECKFHNCKHLNEPKCKVKEAVENGEIYESRYHTYYQLMTEDSSEIYRKNEY
ncbi:MAG: ribosome small subunit-dependent GTPase A [Crocinitomicaceae bacterium]|nr:ribosome small subunit-dependent GTPase A [Crocinitomicaceae bacterium]